MVIANSSELSPRWNAPGLESGSTKIHLQPKGHQSLDSQKTNEGCLKEECCSHAPEHNPVTKRAYEFVSSSKRTKLFRYFRHRR